MKLTEIEKAEKALRAAKHLLTKGDIDDLFRTELEKFRDALVTCIAGLRKEQ